MAESKLSKLAASKLSKLAARLYLPTNRPSLGEIVQYWLRNMLAFIGLAALLAGAFLYVQGRKVLEQYDPRFTAVAAEFMKQSLRGDVASALAVRIPISPDVTIKQAVESMKLRANQLNLPLVGSYVMHKDNASARHTEILEFCDTEIAYKVIRHNPDYLAHMPCRVGILEDNSGRGWLVTVNLNLLIHGSKGMFPELKAQALTVQDSILEIMAAGASGSLDDPR